MNGEVQGSSGNYIMGELKPFRWKVRISQTNEPLQIKMSDVATAGSETRSTGR